MHIFLKLPLQKVSNLNLVGAAVAEINKLNEEKAKKEAALTGNQFFIQNSTADLKKKVPGVYMHPMETIYLPLVHTGS